MIEPKKSLSHSISEDLRAAAGRDGFAQEKGPGVGKGEEEEPAKCFYPWEWVAPAILVGLLLLAKFNGCTKEAPLIVCEQGVLGLLFLILGFVFATSSSKSPCFKTFYAVVPSLLCCYFIPGIFGSMHVASPDLSSLNSIATHYLLPSCLVMFCISIDIGAVVRLGPKAVCMFFAGTLGVMLGGPLSFLCMKYIDEESIYGDEAWRGFTSLAGSWIGGSANQMAMVEVFGVSDKMFSKVVIVDTLCSNIWLACMLVMAKYQDKIDAMIGADTSAIDDLIHKLEDFQEQVKKLPTTTDLIVLSAVGFGATGVSQIVGEFLAPFLEEASFGCVPDDTCGDIHESCNILDELDAGVGCKCESFLTKFGVCSSFFWVVVTCTCLGFAMSFTPLRDLEGAGASKIASTFIYFMVATIGLKMDFSAIAEDPLFLLLGMIWVSFHALVMMIVAYCIKAPIFFMCVGSQANMGAAASAPVIAAAFHPALAPVGVLLAVRRSRDLATMVLLTVLSA